MKIRKMIAAAVLFVVMSSAAMAGPFVKIPSAWKWISPRSVVFSYDGTYADSSAFVFDVVSGKRTALHLPGDEQSAATLTEGVVTLPEGTVTLPEGAVNPTYSPDSSMIAFTQGGDLYVTDVFGGKLRRVTFDGNESISNGYASWVYYEEIFGRQSKYKAFWWSPDSRKIGFYRFDNTAVPIFPIYSPFGQDGRLMETHYPKAGESNPQVRIGIVDVSSIFECCGSAVSIASGDLGGSGDSVGLGSSSDARSESENRPGIVWADFDASEDCYYGTPFWGRGSDEFFISKEPRRQNKLDLYAVNTSDGTPRHIYRDSCDTWLDWIDGALFTEKGLYMTRDSQTGWQQIYFLSYDGKLLRRLTDGPNWGISLLRVDEKKGNVYFTAKRDATIRQTLYKVDSKGVVTALINPLYDVRNVVFSPDGKWFAAYYSNSVTPGRVSVFRTDKFARSSMKTEGSRMVDGSGKADGSGKVESSDSYASAYLSENHSYCQEFNVADMAGADFCASDYALPQFVRITTSDGFVLPASIVYPADFDPSRKYPVHVDIYGGPGSPLVRDRWTNPYANQWWSDNGIIQVVADCRAAGHNGKVGMDMVYKRLTVYEIRDFIAWAEWLQSLPYVDGDKIGVEGFSFGGTMTAMLLLRASENFHYGIAGGGVYDWRLYDTHYTERFMDTPQNNPQGYDDAAVLNFVEEYPVKVSDIAGLSNVEGDDGDNGGDCGRGCGNVAPVMLRLTHGTGDDNVHFQNTLLLVDALQKHGKAFDLMIYPDGMHGYKGYQGEHFLYENRAFWLKYLKNSF